MTSAEMQSYSNQADKLIALRKENAELVALLQDLANWSGPQYAAHLALRGFQADARSILSRYP
jgi:hypothetical protein